MGPRQSGKTTLARLIVPAAAGNYFDLENPASLARLEQLLADRRPLAARFLILGSAADPARSLGISESTVRRYLDPFTGLLMVRQLQPWHANLGKRQVKAPKVHVRDSGLLHTLPGVQSENALLGHPKSGASWEGYAVEEILKATEPDEADFWATHQGAELDLLLFKHGRRASGDGSGGSAGWLHAAARHVRAGSPGARPGGAYPPKRWQRP